MDVDPAYSVQKWGLGSWAAYGPGVPGTARIGTYGTREDAQDAAEAAYEEAEGLPRCCRAYGLGHDLRLSSENCAMEPSYGEAQPGSTSYAALVALEKRERPSGSAG
jgi:hypothetical protein